MQLPECGSQTLGVSESPGELINRLLGPKSEFSHSAVWDAGREHAFLTSSLAVLLLVQEPHFETHCPSDSWGKGEGLPRHQP